MVDAINASQRTFAIAERSAPRRSTTRTPRPSSCAKQGLQLIQAEVARRDVRFDPRFGIGDDGTQKAATGSLSVPVERVRARLRKGSLPRSSA